MLLLLVVHGHPGREKSHLKDHPGPRTKLLILDGLPLIQRSLIPSLQRVSKAEPIPEVSHLGHIDQAGHQLGHSRDLSPPKPRLVPAPDWPLFELGPFSWPRC